MEIRSNVRISSYRGTGWYRYLGIGQGFLGQCAVPVGGPYAQNPVLRPKPSWTRFGDKPTGTLNHRQQKGLKRALDAPIEIRIGPCLQIRRAFAMALLVPQCHQWVDSGCVTSWDIGGDGGDGENE